MTTHNHSTSPRDIVASFNETINQNNSEPAVSVNITGSSTIRLIDGFRPMGIDLAARKFQVCFQENQGRLINTELNKAELRRFLINAEHKYLICIEACSGASYWKRYAESCGHKVKVISGKVTKALNWLRNKDDYIDAYSLYQALFIPGLPSCQTHSEEELAISGLISEKEVLLKNLNVQVNKTRSLLIETGEYDRAIRGADSAMNAIDDYLSAHIHDAVEHRYTIICMKELRKMLVILTKSIDEINCHICEYAMHSEVAGLLLTIPGIGVETAVSIAIDAKSIDRFASARQFQAFFGFFPGHSGSGGKIAMGRMANNGNRAVKRTIYEGALSIYHQGKISGEPRSAWINSKAALNKGAFKKGMIAISSKMLRTAYGVLKSGKGYNPAVDNSLGRMKARLHRRSNPKYREQEQNATQLNCYLNSYMQEERLTDIDYLF